jgi:predicted nucleic acid-binding protein
VFLDTSALFAGLWSAEGGARMLLVLGEAGAVDLLASAQVLAEIERAFRRKATHLLGQLAWVLDQSRVEIAPRAPASVLARCMRLLGQKGDAEVAAAAWAAEVDFLVSLDRPHFLENRALRAAAPFSLGTPGDCLAWLRERLHG